MGHLMGVGIGCTAQLILHRFLCPWMRLKALEKGFQTHLSACLYVQNP